MSDTTTQLNASTGGDVMDESLVTQTDGTTKAKRPRVVIGDDDGNLVDTQIKGGTPLLSVHDAQIERRLQRIESILRSIDTRLAYMTNTMPLGGNLPPP